MSKPYFTSPIQQMIAMLLREHSLLRDDHSRLVANVWYRECSKKKLSTADILGHLSANRLTPPETISRWSRKLQEDYPALRGEKWESRKGRMQKKVKKELGYE